MADIICIGLGDEFFSTVMRYSHDLEVGRIYTMDDLDEALDGEPPETKRVFYGDRVPGLSELELAQYLKSSWPNCRVVLMTEAEKNNQIKDLFKNGVDEIYLLPLDANLLKRELEAARNEIQKEVSNYTSVQMIDLQPDEELDFEVCVYLPLNKKYLKLIKPGQPIRRDKYDKIMNQYNGVAYIRNDEVDKFYDYCAERLMHLSVDNSDISETERKTRLQEAIRALFLNIFDSVTETQTMDSGREILHQSHQLIHSYIQKKTSIDIAEQIKNATGGEHDGYSHSSNVATLAFLFGVISEDSAPEDLAIAGMFHDIALLRTSHNCNETPDLQAMSEKDKQSFMDHPLKAVFMLREKRITVSNRVAEIIEHHHEKADGTGFPRAIGWPRVKTGGQILSLADQFDHQMKVEEGQPLKSPAIVLEEIAKTGSISSEVLAPIKRFFKKEFGENQPSKEAV